jgi:hypothetical protein
MTDDNTTNNQGQQPAKQAADAPKKIIPVPAPPVEVKKHLGDEIVKKVIQVPKEGRVIKEDPD